MQQLAGSSIALAGEPRIAAILRRVCDLTGMGFALFIGAVGGLLPAAQAARKQILEALRDI